MTQVSCPSCKRKGTYSPKNKQCGACGLGYPIAPKVVSMVPDDVMPEVLHDGRITPVTAVTERVTVTESVTNQAEVTAVVPADAPGEDCGCRGHRKAESTAERQRGERGGKGGEGGVGRGRGAGRKT